MRARELPTNHAFLLVRPWVDPVIDNLGHDPRSDYVERFWLGILGPSTTWLLRYLVTRLDDAPDGFDLDLDECATSIGLGNRQGPNAPFPRTIIRCCQFGAGRLSGATLEVRRRLPPLSLRQVSRLPASLQAEHAHWLDEGPSASLARMRERARRLALSLIELGEGREATERQLHRWKFHPAIASEATEWALTRHTAGDVRRRPTRQQLPPIPPTLRPPRSASRPDGPSTTPSRSASGDRDLPPVDGDHWPAPQRRTASGDPPARDGDHWPAPQRRIVADHPTVDANGDRRVDAASAPSPWPHPDHRAADGRQGDADPGGASDGSPASEPSTDSHIASGHAATG